MQDHAFNLLHKEMTRKEFLTTIGVGLVSLMGLSSLLKLVAQKGQQQQISGHGYGASSYGK